MKNSGLEGLSVIICFGFDCFRARAFSGGGLFDSNRGISSSMTSVPFHVNKHNLLTMRSFILDD